MWARVVELMLGAWLVLSPLIFRNTTDVSEYVVNDVVCGSLVVTLALMCFWPPLQRANVATLLVAVWLVGHGYFSAERPGPPAAQNEIVLGLLLLVFAIIPSEALSPPRPWRRGSAG